MSHGPDSDYKPAPANLLAAASAAVTALLIIATMWLILLAGGAVEAQEVPSLAEHEDFKALKTNPYVDLERYGRMFCAYEEAWVAAQTAKHGVAPNPGELHEYLRQEFDASISQIATVIGTPNEVITCE